MDAGIAVNVNTDIRSYNIDTEYCGIKDINIDTSIDADIKILLSVSILVISIFNIDIDTADEAAELNIIDIDTGID